ncbi:hypothetical protein DMUE_4770 [Dictyocoela muelleri]|nr:hypothetical protein DMUE_4770 [Dictyocoela muelleri]
MMAREMVDIRPNIPEELFNMSECGKTGLKRNFNENKVIDALNKLHSDLMHPGKSKFENTIKKYVKIPRLRKLIGKVCFNYYLCQTEKEFSSNIYYPFNSFI